MKRISAITAIAVVFAAAVNAVAYSGGTGDANDPYQIADANDLLALSADANDYNKCFIMTADINLLGQNFTQAVIAPIAGPYFTGKFNGNGHKITHLTINAHSESLGLFGQIESVGEVRNLGIEDCNIPNGLSYIGGIAGFNKGTISNCYCTGVISGYGSVGGVAGASYGGSISYCYSNCSVTGIPDVGGLVGLNINSASINNCHSAGSVRGSTNIGGLAGRNYSNSVIRNCYSTADVGGGLHNAYYAGGLVGKNEYSQLVGDNITDCFSTGPVAGYNYAGGLAGQTRFAGIANCYSTSSVTGESYLGGLAGYKESGSIYKCYSAGTVRTSSGSPIVGGLIGFNSAEVNIVSSFWDVNTSGQMTSAGGQAKTIVEMKTASTFTSAGWDLAEKWDIVENQTYPILRLYSPGDINKDGKVDFYDFAILASHWLD